MARPKKQVKLKEPIKIRLKPLADGNKSIYLDIYWKGVRKYEYLKLYIIPEVNPLCKEQNKERWQSQNVSRQSASRLSMVTEYRTGKPSSRVHNS